MCSPPELADAIDVPTTAVRAACDEVDCPRLGVSFAITRELASEVLEQLESDGFCFEDDDAEEDPEADEPADD